MGLHLILNNQYHILLDEGIGFWFINGRTEISFYDSEMFGLIRCKRILV